MEPAKASFWTESKLEELSAFISGGYSAFSRPRRRLGEIDEKQVARQNEVINFIAETMGLSFSDTLLKMIDMRGMTDPEVYKAAKIDRRVFSKIRSNVSYQPSRNTAIRLCLALRTDPAEAMSLLEKAGFCFSHSKKEDLVVIYCLQNGIYDIDDVNAALSALNLEALV